MAEKDSAPCMECGCAYGSGMHAGTAGWLPGVCRLGWFVGGACAKGGVWAVGALTPYL